MKGREGTVTTMERGKEIEGEREKGKAIKLSGNQVSYDQADSILLEPWGGTGGSEWNYMLKSPIKEILIAHGDVIDSIMFKTIIEQGTTIDSPKFGGDGGQRDKVSFSTLRKDTLNVLDFIESLKNEEIQKAVDVDLTEKMVLELDFLLLNLHHLSKYHAEQLSPFMTEYEILQNVCGNIRDFHELIVNGCVGHEIVEYVLPQFQLMAERVGRFLWPNQIGGHSRLFKLEHLFFEIIPTQLEVMHICFTNLNASTSAEVGHFIKKLLETSPDILREYLIHLQEHMINVITASTPGARNIHIMIEFLLIILTDVPKDFIHIGKLFEFLARVGALTRDVSAIARDLEEKSKNGESTNVTNSATLGLLENIELLKRELKDVYLKAPDSSQLCFPMSDGPLFMHLLLRHLNDLLNSNAYLVALIKEEIRLVKEDLEFIRSFFGNVEQKLYKDLWAGILDVAYVTKDVIDSIIVRDNGLLHLIFSLPVAIEKINLIKEDVSNLFEKIPSNMGVIVVNSPNKPFERNSSIAGKIIVGFKEETYLIIRKLTSGPKTLDVISITGMPGSGKTTLAYKVYNDKSVFGHFDIRAWCTVDQKYDEMELLKKLFNQVTSSTLKFSENIDVADELRKYLFGKRYLIVLDDLWDTAAWDELTRPFPEVEKGSRVILTTREKKVAMHAQRHSDPLDLRLLRPEESWELLEKKVFGKESCPDELVDVGEEIVQNCKRLPLVVDLIAGVIAGKEKKRSVWLEVRNNLNSFIFQKEEDVMKVIELSYDHLPDPLKSCLLYFASYRKDRAIPVELLKRFWRAEGFAEDTEMNSVEEVMDVYLDNLISSSLVISFNEIGKHTTCQIHDLVHDFCLIKAREEKLFDEISSSAPSSSSSDLMPRQMNIEYGQGHFGHNNFDSKNKRHSGKHLYSLRITDHIYHDNSLLYDICHLRHLRLLRVLQLDSFFIRANDSLLNKICTLVHLRYLYIRTEVKSLPSSFSNLWNLETLWVNKSGPPLVILPTIWNLVKLRVLGIADCSFFNLDTDEPILVAEDSKLVSLRLLLGLEVSYSKETEDIFKRFPNLQELRFDLKESWDCSTGRYWFPKLDFLNELESLKVTFKSSNSNDSVLSVATNRLWDFHFPSSVKMLCLCEFPLTSDLLSTIGRLSNLEQLYLKNAIIEGEEWNMGEEDTFQNLKCLTLQRVNLSKWEVREESFPALEKLRLRYCRRLKEIPPSFGDICSLKSIELVRSRRLESSALKIKQDVEDMMGDIQVLVYN
ncbi:putative late blight resistance protein homolog R1A-3 isoform X3 [Nicotiana tabacum]|uniref:Late blight resistance protein homolog R1A-3 isoform X3 n=2 Tax=Nicotiana tabacum TaxID=4097 RepID=A0AC58SYM6_TOBAC